MARLRREKRQAEREEKFDSAALVLGLAERNRQSLEERYSFALCVCVCVCVCVSE